MIERTGAELQIGKLDGAHEAEVVRIAVKAAGLWIRIELPMLDYAQATFGRLVNTATVTMSNPGETT